MFSTVTAVYLTLMCAVFDLSIAYERCQTLSTSVLLTREKSYEYNGRRMRLICMGQVLANKCEGTCQSQASPSIVHFPGLKKDCKCCREKTTGERSVTLDECYDGNRLISGQSISFLIAEPTTYGHSCSISQRGVLACFPNIMDIYHVISVMLLLGCCYGDLHQYSQYNCTLQPLSQVVRRDGCVPIRLITTHCTGYCPSYTHIHTAHDRNQFDRNCECCQATEVEQTTASMMCKSHVNKRDHWLRGRRFQRLEIPIVFPTACICRPCVGGSNYEAQEIRGMDDGVKSLWSILHI